MATMRSTQDGRSNSRRSCIRYRDKTLCFKARGQVLEPSQPLNHCAPWLILRV